MIVHVAAAMTVHVVAAVTSCYHLAKARLVTYACVVTFLYVVLHYTSTMLPL